MDTESLKGKNVLILGASGQVGSNLNKLLVADSIKVTSVRKSKWPNGSSVSSNNLSLDITKDKEYLKDLVHGNDVIFHLAGDIEVQADNDSERDYLLSWIEPLAEILNSMVNTEKTMVFASSCSVYGVNPSLPVKEDTKEEPLTSYDLAKVSCDHIIKYYREVYGVLCTSLRFSNIYSSSAFDKYSSRRVINKILMNIHQKKTVNVIETGEFMRNYIHVKDVVNQLVYAIEHINSSPPVLLACSKENYLFIDIISMLIDSYKKRFGESIKINFGMKKRFPTDIRQFSAVPSKLFTEDFVFSYDLKKGFEELVDEL